MSKVVANEPGRGIEIWLTKQDAGAAWVVNSVRKKYEHHLQRIVFDNAERIAAVLCEPIAQLLAEHLVGISGPSVFSDKEWKLELDNLKLTGLRVIANGDPQGRLSCLVRFVVAEGEPTAVLVDRFSAAPAVRRDVIEMTVPILTDLLFPALEIFDHIVAHGLSEHDHDAVRARLKTLVYKREALGDLAAILLRLTSKQLAQEDDEQNNVPLRYREAGSPIEVAWSARDGWQSSVTSDPPPSKPPLWVIEGGIGQERS